MSDCASLARALLSKGSAYHRNAIAVTLERFESGALRFALAGGIRITPLEKREEYRSASQALARLGIDVDAWPAPPAGLFVVEERTVYLRSRSPMTVAHEFGHALDCALGNGAYLSGVDPRIRTHFDRAVRFVTPYAATGVDEYFAEAFRAYVGVNDAGSFWPRVSRERLRQIDLPMYDYVDDLFRNRFSTGRLTIDLHTPRPSAELYET